MIFALSYFILFVSNLNSVSFAFASISRSPFELCTLMAVGHEKSFDLSYSQLTWHWVLVVTSNRDLCLYWLHYTGSQCAIYNFEFKRA